MEGYVAKMFPKTFPHIPGFDVAGVVIAVGANVKDFAVGDQVYSDTMNTESSGTFSEYCAIEEFRLAKKPKNLTFAEAASIPLAVLTSHQALEALPVKKDSKILILGGGGGCGECNLFVF